MKLRLKKAVFSGIRENPPAYDDTTDLYLLGEKKGVITESVYLKPSRGGCEFFPKVSPAELNRAYTALIQIGVKPCAFARQNDFSEPEEWEDENGRTIYSLKGTPVINIGYKKAYGFRYNPEIKEIEPINVDLVN